MNKTLAEDIKMLAEQYGGVGELHGKTDRILHGAFPADA